MVIQMLTLEIDDEIENKLRIFAEQEHTTPELFVKKLINQYQTTHTEDDFFSSAGLWQDRDITQESLRAEIWRKS